jgi:hypothetical protein
VLIFLLKLSTTSLTVGLGACSVLGIMQRFRMADFVVTIGIIIYKGTIGKVRFWFLTAVVMNNSIFPGGKVDEV